MTNQIAFSDRATCRILLTNGIDTLEDLRAALDAKTTGNGIEILNH